MFNSFFTNTVVTQTPQAQSPRASVLSLCPSPCLLWSARRFCCMALIFRFWDNKGQVVVRTLCVFNMSSTIPSTFSRYNTERTHQGMTDTVLSSRSQWIWTHWVSKPEKPSVRAVWLTPPRPRENSPRGAEALVPQARF